MNKKKKQRQQRRAEITGIPEDLRRRIHNRKPKFDGDYYRQAGLTCRQSRTSEQRECLWMKSALRRIMKQRYSNY